MATEDVLARSAVGVAGGPLPGATRTQLSSLRALLGLSMAMTRCEREGDVIRLAASAVGSFADARTEAVMFAGLWQPVVSEHWPVDRATTAAQLDALDGASGPVAIPGRRWAWAYPMPGAVGNAGYLVVSANQEPVEYDRFLLQLLAQHAGVALENARLHARERSATEDLQAAYERVEASMATVQRRLEVHERLTAAAASTDRLTAIARAVNDLTGFPVAIEDRHGNLRVWAGSGCPDPYPKDPPARRERLLRQALEAGGPVRDRGRLVTLAQPGVDVLGLIALVDPDASAGELDQVALEHAGTVLTLELAHLRSVAEAELRLGRDLFEDLLAGTEPDGTRRRARALGYDIDRPHRVVVVVGRGKRDPLLEVVRRARRDGGRGLLVTSRGDDVVLLAPADVDADQLRQDVLEGLGPRSSCRIGVSGVCTGPGEFARSYRQADLAVKVQRATQATDQVTLFDHLGVYGLFSEHADLTALEAFVRRWLGPLIDYDQSKGTQLVETLSTYLECGGSYDATAELLSLHRSSLRYRLSRLREISGHDLGRADTRFNLQLATRAWRTLRALQGF